MFHQVQQELKLEANYFIEQILLTQKRLLPFLTSIFSLQKTAKLFL